MITTFLFPAQALVSRADFTIRVYKENEELKKQNVILRSENDQLRQLKMQWPRLMGMKAYEDSSRYPLIYGKVVADSPDRFSASVVINLGTGDSISRNMPVLTPHGIVGKIADTRKGHSLVQLLNDPDFKVSIYCNRSRAKGILESYSFGKIVARFNSEADVRKGDTLLTTGLGGVFPKGLSVGAVKNIKITVDDIQRTVEVQPFQDLNVIEEVFVLKRNSNWTFEKDSSL